MPFHHHIIRNRDTFEPSGQKTARLVAHLLDELSSIQSQLEDMNHSAACKIVESLYDHLIDAATTQLGYDISLQ